MPTAAYSYVNLQHMLNCPTTKKKIIKDSNHLLMSQIEGFQFSIGITKAKLEIS